MSFAGKTVLITGAAKGIGKQTAQLFANQGANLALVDFDANGLESLVEELKLTNYLLLEADVTKEEQVENYVKHTKKKFGNIDVFFNNAGIEGNVAPIIETSAENLEKVLNVNIKGVFFGLKHVMTSMVEQKFGSIINMASITGLRGSVGLAPYSASKHAVIGLTKTAALEGADMGIRVNAICPGYVDSRMMQSIEEQAAPNNSVIAREKAMSNVPLNRYAQQEEIANLVLFLASDNASYITGGQYVVDGGLLS